MISNYSVAKMPPERFTNIYAVLILHECTISSCQPWLPALLFGLQYLYLSNEGVNSHRILLVASDRCQIQLAYSNNYHLPVHVNCKV